MGARHHDSHLKAASAKGYNPLLASYGPALIDRAILDALCRRRGVSFYTAMQGNLPGIGGQQREFAGFDFEQFLPALQPSSTIEARHTVGMLDAITAHVPGDTVELKVQRLSAALAVKVQLTTRDALLHKEYLHVSDIETQLPPVFERFWSTPERRICRSCGTVMQAP